MSFRKHVIGYSNGARTRKGQTVLDRDGRELKHLLSIDGVKQPFGDGCEKKLGREE